MLRQRILQEQKRLTSEINKLETQLKSFPDGKLICCNHRNTCNWYQSDGQNRIYIPKSRQAFAEQLAIKKYLSCLLSDILQEKNALDAYLKRCPDSHKTISGHLVRSKSEAMICHFLYTNQIPFRYECALYLDDHPIYPDFTIRHPETGETCYWEHFGLMDDATYCRNMASKMQLYSTHGIIPSIQLITTYETSEHPLTIDTIQKTIEEYFL